MMTPLDTASAPQDIERRSFEIIDAEIPPPRPWSGILWEVCRRCIHALGDTGIMSDLVLDEAAAEAGIKAMLSSCRIYTDTRMLAAGLVARRMMPLGVQVHSIMELPEIGMIAHSRGITRSRAGIEMIAGQWGGQIVAIGNAPTALLALLEEMADCPEHKRPALVVGMPVGFVNATQSKELLRKSSLPCFTLLGRKGGSAAAAACINALAEVALRRVALNPANFQRVSRDNRSDPKSGPGRAETTFFA